MASGEKGGLFFCGFFAVNDITFIKVNEKPPSVNRKAEKVGYY